jgi:hypothetical protein
MGTLMDEVCVNNRHPLQELEANIQQEICIIPRQKFHRVSRNIFLKM